MAASSFVRIASLAALSLVTEIVGCAASDEPLDEDESAAVEEDLSAGKMNVGWTVGFASTFENPAFDDMWTSTKGEAHSRICHAYPAWDVASQDPGTKGNGQRESWQAIYDRATAANEHCELLVTFKMHDNQIPRSVDAYEKAFLAFRKAWPKVRRFTAWNEANNNHGAGNGLDDGKTILGPERAAEHYLAIRKHCAPKDNCIVAAGDILAWTNMAALKEECPGKPEDGCADGSFLDQYKNAIVTKAERFGLPKSFRPEYWALHPWFDSFNYTQHKAHCQSADDCATRAMLRSLDGSWKNSRVWITEIGVNHEGPKGFTDEKAQACGAAFVLRLFAISDRITKVYYSHFCGAGANGDSALVDACKMPARERQAFTVLRNREANVPGCF